MKKVAVYAFDGISMFHLSVPIAIFNDADPSLEFHLQVFSDCTGVISTSDGTQLQVENDISFAEQADIVIIPSWLTDKVISEQLLALLAKPDKKFVGLCLGAYALAYAGLLENKEATTHWAYAEDFSIRFPNVKLKVDALFVDTENVITSAGTAAAIDCCLSIVKQQLGAKTANQVARIMVSAPVREGGQKQFIQYPVPERDSDSRLAKLVARVLADLSAPITLKQAAHLVAMSERNFSRHFKAIHGTSFVKWLTKQRLNLALDLLESSDLSVGRISELIGMSSEQNFRKQFKFHFSSTPNDWRKRFRVK